MRSSNDFNTQRTHDDYSKNLHHATNFVNNVASKILNGMHVGIKDSEGLQKSMVTIAYTGRDSRYAFPVCLHQSNNEFKSELTNVFNNYFSYAKQKSEENQLTLGLKC